MVETGKCTVVSVVFQSCPLSHHNCSESSDGCPCHLSRFLATFREKDRIEYVCSILLQTGTRENICIRLEGNALGTDDEPLQVVTSSLL